MVKLILFAHHFLTGTVLKGHILSVMKERGRQFALFRCIPTKLLENRFPACTCTTYMLGYQ